MSIYFHEKTDEKSYENNTYNVVINDVNEM